MNQVLAPADVVRFLRHLMLAERRAVSMCGLAARAQVSRKTLYMVARTGRVSETLCTVLTPVIAELGRDEHGFPRADLEGLFAAG